METRTLAQLAGDAPIPRGEDSGRLVEAGERMSDDAFAAYLDAME